jgi:hypothetical protein
MGRPRKWKSDAERMAAARANAREHAPTREGDHDPRVDDAPRDDEPALGDPSLASLVDVGAVHRASSLRDPTKLASVAAAWARTAELPEETAHPRQRRDERWT